MNEHYKSLLKSVISFCYDVAKEKLDANEDTATAQKMVGTFSSIKQKIENNEELTASDWIAIEGANNTFVFVTKARLTGIVKIFEEDLGKKLKEVKANPKKANEIFSNT